MDDVRNADAHPNRLLARLPLLEREALGRRLDRVQLKRDQLLYDLDAGIDRVYFVVDGLVAVSAETRDGDGVEVAMIGREGLAGLPLFFGEHESHDMLRTVIQGEALAMMAADFIDAMRASSALRAAIRTYAGAYVDVLARSAACNHAHRLSRRLARLLLRCHDASHSDAFAMTQEVLAQMLGAQRPSVSLAAEALGRDQVIAYRRGRVRVTDRARLEGESCACYSMDRSAFARL